MTRPLARVGAWPTLVLALAVGLGACSTQAADTGQTPDSAGSGSDTAAAAAQNDALDAVVAAAQPTIADVLDASGGVFSEIEILSVHPSTLEYVYVYAEQVDPEAAASYFDANLSAFQDVCDAEVFPAMVGAGVTDNPLVLYVYRNADGSDIWSHTFAPS